MIQSARRPAVRARGARVRPLVSTALALACAAPLLGRELARQTVPASPGPLQIQITSPLGRTGVTGAVRVVARVVAPASASLSPVQFFIDGKLLGEDKDGPPYAVEWKDDNPFEARQIAAQVADSEGHSARDVVELKPLEVNETTSISAVILDTSVVDAKGRPVNGLKAADFTVFEDDVPQKLDMAGADTMPATYTLLIDSSQSMSRRMDFVREAAGDLPAHLRPDDQVVIVPFSKTLGAVTGPTKDRETIAGAIDAIQSSGGTSIIDCLEDAARRIEGVKGRQIIVLITDGYDENSRATFEDSLEAVKATQATVYVIGIGGIAGISLRGEDMLKRLALETGGRAFFPAREFQLTDVHGLIAEDVQDRYLISYTPLNQRLDGSYRAIKVVTADPARTVRTRDGYYAPAPPPIRPQIELTIRDTARQLIDVSAEDLVVIEDGVEQKIEGFEESLAPVSIVLALDASGSMKKDAAALVDAARRFVAALPAKDQLAVLMFADKPVLAHDLTTLREWALDAIGKYQANGGTALYDAVSESLTQLRKADARRVVVVFTDGRDENNPGTGPGSVHTLDEVLKSVRDVGATIYGIGLGPKVDKDTIERLATASAGEAYFPADVTTLDGEYRRVLENLRRRYTISYTSTNVVHDGAWRKVEIRSKRTGVVIDSKGGYFAPKG
jgi:Ca-activated chloride channel homolog